MKLAARDLAAFLNAPDPGIPALLIYGSDAMRVALKREEAVAAIAGPDAAAEMRVTRLAPADLREDPARLIDEIKATGFFPGARCIFLEGAADAQTKLIATALEEWRKGDAHLVITAGQLAARSALRKLFEGHRTALVAAIYDDPPAQAEIERILRAAGLAEIERDASALLADLARHLDPGDFRQTVEKIALYKLQDESALTTDEVASLAPDSGEASVDDVLNAVAESEIDVLTPLLSPVERSGLLARQPLHRRDAPFPDALCGGGGPGRAGAGHRARQAPGVRAAAGADAAPGAGLGGRATGTGRPDPHGY